MSCSKATHRFQRVLVLKCTWHLIFDIEPNQIIILGIKVDCKLHLLWVSWPTGCRYIRQCKVGSRKSEGGL